MKTHYSALWSIILFLALCCASPQSAARSQTWPTLNTNQPLPSLTANADAATTKPLTHVNLQRNSGPPVFTIRTDMVAFNHTASIETFKRISLGAQRFGLELLSKLSDTLHQNNIKRDFMISPFAVWSLLMLLAEGAAGRTLQQLRSTLHIDDNQAELRKAFREVQTYLKINTSTIEVASLQAMFTDVNQPVKRDFETIIERDYGSQLIPVDFHDPITTAERINYEVRDATRGLIPYSVLPQDLKDANLFLMSSLYFKGQWKLPFNQSLTRTETFYDVDGQPMGNVEMMVQESDFNFVGIAELEGHVLELPYGKENRLSMLIILPRSGVSLNKIIHNLAKVGVDAIFNKLTERAAYTEDMNVEVLMPKFTTSTDLSLHGILEELGLLDIFDPNAADLSKMSESVFVSNIIHSSKIIVNEEGTTAAAVASAVLTNKQIPPKFYLNRPFMYLIIEKSTNLLLFSGQVTNPNKL